MEHFILSKLNKNFFPLLFSFFKNHLHIKINISTSYNKSWEAKNKAVQALRWLSSFPKVLLNMQTIIPLQKYI